MTAAQPSLPAPSANKECPECGKTPAYWRTCLDPDLKEFYGARVLVCDDCWKNDRWSVHPNNHWTDKNWIHKYHDWINGRWYVNYNKSWPIGSDQWIREEMHKREMAQIKLKNNKDRRQKLDQIIKRKKELKNEFMKKYFGKGWKIRKEPNKVKITLKDGTKKEYNYIRCIARKWGEKPVNLGRDWYEVFDKRLWHRACTDVYGSNYIAFGFSPVEEETLDFLTDKLIQITQSSKRTSRLFYDIYDKETEEGRKVLEEKRLIKYYTNKLGLHYMYYRGYRLSSINRMMGLKEMKLLLQSARRVLKNHNIFMPKSITKRGTELLPPIPYTIVEGKGKKKKIIKRDAAYWL